MRPVAAARQLDGTTARVTFRIVVVNRASLLVVQGVEQGARFELGEQPIAMGRGVQNEVRILDTEVSRLHATIQRVKDTFVLTDRNSSNGTLVNGVAVRSHSLADGDLIQLGHTLLLFADAERESLSHTVAERVHLLQRHDPADRSSIVSEIDRQVLSSSAPSIPAGEENSPSNLAVLYRIAEEVVRPSVSMDQSLQRILDLTIEAVGADRGCVLLTDPQSGEIRPRVASQRGAAEPGSRMPVSRTIVDYVLKNNQGVRTTDAQHDSRFDPARSIVQAGIREAMCVPMQGRHELMGVIYIDITTPADRLLLQGKASGFREDQLRLLIAIGRQAALAVENNRYQQAFVKAERLAAMGQTIATLSHHIKNILQGVRGGSYLIDMGLNDHNEELVRKGWHVVEKNQNKIYHLVMDMLTFSKERQPALVPAQLNETVSDVVELMQARAAECSVDLQFRPDANLPMCTFDPEGIHRAVLNIVTNAIDAVEGSDRALVLVETGLHHESDMLWVAVSDNGPGIPEDQLTRIFNVFESTKGARGTGLGLAVSLKIIREHGGDIAVESRLGEGSRFTLAWPRLDEDHPLVSQSQV
ncbi:MAG: GAF domain-containing protein [Candidatus Saccharimonas sp.]|nr:GAF domain-containing protein [Planctomycetaceae bacterium]